MAKRHSNNAGVHILFSGIMVSIAVLLIVYAVVFVHNPNEKYKNGKTTECKIISAKKSCWRRKLFGSSRIEQGRHICWLFLIRYDDVFTKVQYMSFGDFPDEQDGCNSATSCGLERWPCRVSKDDPNDVALGWVYPVRKILLACFGIASTLLLGTLAGWHFYRERRVDDESFADEMMKEEPVPFSFRKRLPTWMGKDLPTTTMPPRAAMSPWQGP